MITCCEGVYDPFLGVEVDLTRAPLGPTGPRGPRGPGGPWENSRCSELNTNDQERQIYAAPKCLH